MKATLPLRKLDTQTKGLITERLITMGWWAMRGHMDPTRLSYGRPSAMKETFVHTYGILSVLSSTTSYESKPPHTKLKKEGDEEREEKNNDRDKEAMKKNKKE